MRWLSITATALAFHVQALVTALSIVSREPVAGGVDLRILPFGDSITWGQASSDGNGYRLELYNRLSPTNSVDFLGSLKHGSMEKNRNEGHQGYDIELIREKGMPDLKQRPNVVLLMLGTNNIVRNVHYDKAPRLLSNLIEFTIESCPDAAILVATITPLRNLTQETQRLAFNLKLPEIIGRISSQGHHVALVDTNEVKEEHINSLDNVHPTDAGYQILGRLWYDAIVMAGRRRWIKAPVDLTSLDQQDTDETASGQSDYLETAQKVVPQGKGNAPPAIGLDSLANNSPSIRPAYLFFGVLLVVILFAFGPRRRLTRGWR